MANLINGLGGVAGFGENTLALGDDNSSVAIGLSGLFGIFPAGLELFGAVRNQLFINNNGNVTFGGPNASTFGQTNLSTLGAGPVIAPFWADVDTRAIPVGGVTPGGTSTGSNSVYWDFDFATQTFSVTWDDVGRFASDNSVRNAFQLRLIKATDPLAQADDFQIELRYENINWATSSGGTGTAVAGIGDGTGATAITLPQSGNNALMLDLESQTNVGDAGRFVFTVRNGVVQVPGAGDQVLAGTSANDRLDAQGGNDTLFGLAGDDTLVGAQGNDVLDGGLGFDSADYGRVGAAVTLLSQGVIAKGALGTDTIANIERIVGAVGFANLIDGQIAGPQTTSFNIDLLFNSLTVNGIPGLGSVTFTVENFVNVRGTANNDQVFGGNANSVFFGTRGSDTYFGEVGFDTIDYSGLGGAVTLLSQGVINKGTLGTDTIDTMERIVGAAGFANFIDGQIVGPQTTSFVVDLAAQSLTVNGIPFLGSASFQVANFVNVRGTLNSDAIRGDSAANVFFGTVGNDTYDGIGGFDTIDYSGLGGAVTLLSQGIISKGALGTDSIANMERIVGAAGFGNFIDGQIVGPQTTSFVVDLAAQTLAVNGIPFLGTANFQVVNFRDVRGTLNNDVIRGDTAGNTFFGTRGTDTYDGRSGADAVDYSSLGGAITLLSQGVISKGALGIDSIANMERIVGAAGFVNVIDGTVAVPATQTTSFVVDLGANSLTVNGIPGLGSASFTVLNFVNVIGTNNADFITGNTLANTLNGAGGVDNLRGGDGDDTLFGGASGDILNGGNGFDSVNYQTAAAGLTLNLANTALNTGDAAGDSYVQIENFIGSNFNDRLTGSGSADQIVGAIGDDTVNGGNGSDIVGGGSGNDSVLGGKGNDSVSGGTDNDTLNGGTGNDTLTGAKGVDTLIGGAGLDVFVYNDRNEGSDLITDFNVAQDDFLISNAGFGNTLPLGVLAAGRFASNPTASPTAAVAQFLYDSDGGQLFFDIDGLGAQGPTLLATLTGAPALTAANFTVIA